MNRHFRILLTLFFCAIGFTPHGALADSATAPECPIKGQSCTVPGPSPTPVQGTCGDGACWICDSNKASTYTCPRCLTADELASSTGAVKTPRESEPSCSGEGNCSVQHVGTEGGLAAVMLAIGVAALTVARRRKEH